MLVVVRDKMPAGMALAGELAHFVPGVEDESQRVAFGRGQFRGMEAMPKTQMALLAIEVGGFG